MSAAAGTVMSIFVSTVALARVTGIMFLQEFMEGTLNAVLLFRHGVEPYRWPGQPSSIPWMGLILHGLPHQTENNKISRTNDLIGTLWKP